MAEKKKISFRAKQKTQCPVCGQEFQREELLSGGGRMNAGELTKELHRQYLPTERYGYVYPMIYPVTVCPRCYFAAYGKDFENPGKDSIGPLKDDQPNRIQQCRDLLPQMDFDEDRGLEQGVASYLLAMLSYEHMKADHFPTFRQGLSALRAAWLCMEAHKRNGKDNWDYLAQVFYRKAAFFYAQTVEKDQNGKETSSQLSQFGPDVDQNYGFDGVIYLAALLEFSYGQRNNPEVRGETLKRARSTVSRIVGMGKSSKSKPGVLLDHSRDLHKDIKDELEELGVES